MTAGKNGTTAALEADIARQRAELADTVDQLQAKLDVKARAQGKVRELKARATTDTGKPQPALLGAAAGALALVALVAWLRRR